MTLHTNKQTLFIGRSVSLFVLLFFLLFWNNIYGQIGQNTAYYKPLTQTNFSIEDNLIPEQDPHGILYGLRDTVSGKMILDYTYQKIWNFKDGFATVILNDKFGLIDYTGKQIIEPGCDFPKTSLECGFIAFEIGYGPILIFDVTRKYIIPMISGMTGFLPCQNRITYGHYQFGMLNLKWDTILPFIFTDAFLLPEGFCVASKADKTGFNSLYGLYDLDGKQVLPHVFDRISSFYFGRAIVKKNGKYGIIDESGKELFYTDYGRIDNYYNDYAIVYTKQINNEIKVGIIDKNGNEVVPAIYQWLDYVYNFSEGMAAMAHNFKYGFVDTTGKVVIPFKYDRVESFKDGIAKVWVGWCDVGYINKKGEDVIPPHFESMDQVNLGRYYDKFIIGIKDSVQHVFDYSGKEIAILPYETIRQFNENEKSYIVTKNNQSGTLDSNFRIQIPLEYGYLDLIFPNRIAAYKNGKIGFIDQLGKVISPFEYDLIDEFHTSFVNRYENGLVKVVKKGKFGLINSYGNLIIPVIYDEIENFSYGLAVVKRNKKYGFVNDKGKEIIPAIYDKVNPFDGYSAEVTLKGETFQIDISGNRVIEDDY